MADAGVGFHWMSLKQRRSSETEGNLGRVIQEVDDHCLHRAPARRLLPLPAIGFEVVPVMEEENLDWQRFEG
jgi:hypothetical protein